MDINETTPEAAAVCTPMLRRLLAADPDGAVQLEAIALQAGGQGQVRAVRR